jgi:hypothetical protein
VAIDVVPVFAAVQFDARLQLFDDLVVAGDGRESGQPVLVGDDAVERFACGALARPTDEAGHSKAPSHVGVLLAMERRRAGIGPRVVVRAVVGRIHARSCRSASPWSSSSLEQLADHVVVLDHAVVVFVPLLPLMPMCSFFTWVRKCMRVAFHQQKNGLPGLRSGVR